jgi:hypothetical protein
MSGPKAHFPNIRMSVEPQPPIDNVSLQLDDVDRGMLLNRLTSAQEAGIVNPVTGTILFNTTNNRFEFYDGSSWEPIGYGVGSGTVSSVTFTGDGTVFSSTPSSAVTSTGTLTATLKTQSANTILAGPSSGGPANPTFRALALTDLPSGVGTVTSITANNGLSGGTITSTGTIGISSIAGPGFLANASNSFAVPIATTLTSMLDAVIGAVQGNLIYRSGFIWTALSPGTAGQVLTTGGASANPSWTTPASQPTSANPSVLVSLAAVDGSATTFMTSDSAPALDQSIAPTWTGYHIFSGGALVNANSSLTLDSPSSLVFSNAGSVRWQISLNGTETGSNSGSNFTMHRYSDSETLIDVPFNIVRSSGQASFSVRPSFNGNTPWDSGNFTPGDYLLLTGGTLSGSLSVTGDVNVTDTYKLGGLTVLSQPGGVGGNNLGVGLGTLVSTTGTDNTALGQLAGAAITTGTNNLAVGYAALSENTIDYYNTAVGCQALQQLNSSDASSTENTAVGYGTLSYLTSGSNNTLNTAVGSLAMGTSAGASVQQNTVIGAHAGYKLIGSNNTLLGSGVGSVMLTSGSNNILIGVSDSVDTPANNTVGYINIGQALDGTSGEYNNTVNCGIRSLGYYGESSYGYATNAAFTVYNGCSTFIIDTTSPSGFALTAPPNPVDGQFLTIACGNNGLSIFSFLPNAGQSINYAPTTLAANTSIKYLYRATNTTWYKIG